MAKEHRHDGDDDRWKKEEEEEEEEEVKDEQDFLNGEGLSP